MAQEGIGGGGDVGGGPGAVDEPPGGQFGGSAAVVDADPHAAALVAGRDDVAAEHRQPPGRGERGGAAGGRGRYPVAVHLPVTGDMAEEQALVRLRQLFPEAGDLRLERVDDVLPVAGVYGGAGTEVVDQPGEAERACRRADDRHCTHSSCRARPVMHAGEHGVAGDGVHGRARVGVGERDRHVQHGEAGAQHGDRAAVRRRLKRAGLPWIGDVAVPMRNRAGRNGRQVAGGQHGGIGVDPAVRSQVQAQCAAAAAAPDRHDFGGDAADPRRWLR